MEGRDLTEAVAVTRMRTGTDVDYGALTNDLLDSLSGKPGFSILYSNRVLDLSRDGNLWKVTVRDERPASTAMSRPNSCSSARAVVHLSCSKSPAFPKVMVTQDFP